MSGHLQFQLNVVRGGANGTMGFGKKMKNRKILHLWHSPCGKELAKVFQSWRCCEVWW